MTRRTRRAGAGACLGLIGVGLVIWAGLLWRGPGPLDGPPRDAIPTDWRAPGATTAPLRVTLFGTSLSSPRYDWPEAAQDALSACLDRPVLLTRVTQPGGNIAWAEGEIPNVVASAPDLVLVEFAINDADLIDGVGLEQGRTRLSETVLALSAGADGPAIILLTMSPAHGLRGVVRPRLAGHYAAVAAVAADHGAGVLDLETRWRALPRAERGLQADGLHPDPAIARDVIVPPLTAYLCDLLR